MIVHAEKHTNGRPTGHNFGLNTLGYSMIWAGMSGMHWDALVTTVHAMLKCFGIQKMIILHCGGNDISDVSCGNLLFILNLLCLLLAKCCLVQWCVILTFYLDEIIVILIIKKLWSEVEKELTEVFETFY